MKKLTLLAAAAVAMSAAAPRAASAQAVINNTTIPIVVVTLFTPGTVPVPVDPAVADAVVIASKNMRDEKNIISPITGVAVPPEIARVVIAMMTDATPAVRDQVHNALAQSGASATVINQLMSNLPSLLSNPTAGQVQNALSSFNGYINNSNAAFLVNPPAEFLAIHAILLQISTAANAVPH